MLLPVPHNFRFLVHICSHRHCQPIPLNLRWFILVVHKQPQYRFGNFNAIMLQMCRLGRLTRMLKIRNPAAIHPHLDLSFHHVLVKRQMRLSRKQPVRDVQPLNRRMLAAPPAQYLGVRGEQLVPCRRRSGQRENLVLVHLVQVDVVLARAEETAADGREHDAAVTQFPVLRGSGPNGAAEEAGEELVAEADAHEVELRAFDPESPEELQQVQDPLVVPVRIVHAARDEQAVKAVEFLHGWDAAALFGHDEDLVRLHAQRRTMGASSFGKVRVDNAAKGAALRVCVWVRLVGLEDHQAYDGRRWRGFVGLIHAV